MASVKDLTRFGVDLSSARLISVEDFENLVKQGCRPEVGDVLIAKDGNSALDTVCSVSSLLDAVLLSSVAILRPDPAKIDTDFLKFYLSSTDVIDYLKSTFISGAAIPRVVLRDFKKAEISIPPITSQRNITSVLNALENRIFLLRETNATLEAIAQALFKSWFVDFDPVRAKMEGRAPEGMDEATAALFPDALEESELGWVPKGWQICALDEIATYLNGLALQKFPPTGTDDLPVIKIAQLRKGDTAGADRAARSLKQDYVIQNGDVLFSWSGSLEVEIWCGGEGALNQHLFKVTSSRYPKWFYYFWTRHHLEHFRQVAASKATTMGHIQRSHLSAAKVSVPSLEVLNMGNELLEPLVNRVVENRLQAQTLSTLRDTLLPRLISGQLRLPEAEAATEAALSDALPA
ncbi:MAG: restriction endonuclease subunit S [Giesbergeria sp.]|jgi:type I restriction enzyme S subunit|nr:restriction endonuclease subunit S [Giesbergeria sp.]MBP6160410.1 restriction endonuclease subunit S [Giesbergeria sp.]MBP7084808.1 restriction endonuclease subunit S [Giesbergeria sp.]MBP9784954.1 restriction endonuclease subunit S [Giesbergeria sp.]MBP9895662.1 restriction endonuclease subunit S [Giesbergeria sp.]